MRRPTAPRRDRWRWPGLLAALGPIPGCAGDQSALDPAGPQAGRIGSLFWLYLGVCLVVYVGVALAIVWAYVRRGRRRRMPLTLSPPADRERRLWRWVVASIAGTVATLFVLLGGDYATGRAVHGLAASSELTIRVTGHQWWWQVEYPGEGPSELVTTANEIHIPVGRTVRVELRSADVIHSFWVPNLHGKRDLIPDHPTQTFLRADRPGTFVGQCAEFCGFQHAMMRLVVVAEPEEQFRSWLRSRGATPPEPETEAQRRGRRVFLGTTCVMCHTIRRTEAGSRFGPDLSHVASRPLIAGAVPNVRGNLAGWIVDPHAVKPGVRMPMNPLAPDDLRDLLDYLETLK